MTKLWIALRYIFSRKSHSIINLISIISVIAVAVPVAAAVFILSLHNGLSKQIYGIYTQFDPDVKITPKQGLFFNSDSIALAGVDFVDKFSFVLEQGVMMECNGNQVVAVLRGVDPQYNKVVEIDNLITHGEFKFSLGDLDEIVLGQGVGYSLGINPSLHQSVGMYSLNTNPVIMLPLFAYETAKPAGFFSMDKQTDDKYVFCSIDQAQRLFGKNNEISSIDIKLKDGVDPSYAVLQLKSIIGNDFDVKTKSQQRDSVFKVINIEKWITMLLVGVIITIAGLSLVGAIVIMIVEKSKQNQTLLTLGYKVKNIKTIYTYVGISISFSGIVLGFILGLGFVILQSRLGILSMGEANFITDIYPVEIIWSDLLIVFLSVFIITSFITIITTKVAKIDSAR